MSFAAKWDRRLRLSTALICIVLISMVLIMPWDPALFVAIKGVLVSMIIGIWAWAPKGYRIINEYLVVKRMIGDVRISLVGLSRARLMIPEELRGTFEIWAVGGFFGYFGRFLNGIEQQTWYVTDREKCVRLDCPAGIFVVSPLDPEAFLSALPLRGRKA